MYKFWTEIANKDFFFFFFFFFFLQKIAFVFELFLVYYNANVEHRPLHHYVHHYVSYKLAIVFSSEEQSNIAAFGAILSVFFF